MLVGTAVWVVAFVVAVLLAWAGDDATWTPAWVCATGVVRGLLGMGWARRHSVRRR